MMINALLHQRIHDTQSFLCVGLDPQVALLKQLGMENHLLEYNKKVIDSVADLTCAFKPQMAHYAALGMEKALEDTCHYIKKNYPHILLILDGKRGDIGTTSEKYAQEIFERYNADAATVNPYMGSDVLKPFLAYENKATIALIKTSNPSSDEFQNISLDNGLTFYQHVAKTLHSTCPNNNLWFVVGATAIEAITYLRQHYPTTTFLVPGVGAQGGNSDAVIGEGMDSQGNGLLINVSRGITNQVSPSEDSFSHYLDTAREHANQFCINFKLSREKHLTAC